MDQTVSLFRVGPAPVFAEWIPADTGPVVNFRSAESPFGVATVIERSAAAGPMTRGFPRSEAVVHEWIPGVSTPDGLVLGTMAAAMFISLIEFQAFERAVQGVASLLVVGVTTALPAGAVWFGSSLFMK